MVNTPDVVSCFASAENGGELLPLSPYNSLSYHFGMLLGVEDFETEQAYHRAKMRLHNAWLHREGVVWGFGVVLDVGKGEIRVERGLALDAAGHELHLEGDACVNVGQWFVARQNDPDFKFTIVDDVVRFDLYVCLRFKACLTRQVPAMIEPCKDMAGGGTAYSRVFETVEILLRPEYAKEKKLPYHRLRLLFELEETETHEGAVTESDKKVLAARAEIQALPAAKRPAAMMKAFHRFAALDEIDLRPEKSPSDERLLLFPGADDEVVVLANLSAITLEKLNDKWMLKSGEVDTSVRPSHVATTTIQDLLCGPLMVAPKAEEENIGPRVDRDLGIVITERAIIFTVDKSLLVASVKAAAFSVTWLDKDRGWQRANIADASYGGDETRTVTLELKSAVSGRVRLIVHGTGPHPLLGADLIPFAGAVGGPPGTRHNGHDFVHMQDFVKTEVKEEEVGLSEVKEEDAGEVITEEAGEVKEEESGEVTEEATAEASEKEGS
jgi:hypothetical protein